MLQQQQPQEPQHAEIAVHCQLGARWPGTHCQVSPALLLQIEGFSWPPPAAPSTATGDYPCELPTAIGHKQSKIANNPSKKQRCIWLAKVPQLHGGATDVGSAGSAATLSHRTILLQYCEIIPVVVT